jgi:hypothetical protein
MSALTVHILAAVGIVPVAWLTVIERLKIRLYNKKNQENGAASTKNIKVPSFQ